MTKTVLAYNGGNRNILYKNSIDRIVVPKTNRNDNIEIVDSKSISNRSSNKGGWNYTKLTAYTKNMKTQMTRAKNALKGFGNDILAIEKGDSKKAYWSGSRAVTQLKELRAHYNTDVQWLNGIDEMIQVLDQIAKYKL